MLHMLNVSCTSPYDAYLTNYWPISNCHLNDLVGHADMMQVADTSFATDRLGNPKSALDLNGSWIQAPPGVYFSAPQFTISAWIYPQGLSSWTRIFDFGDGAAIDNIFISFDSGGNQKPAFFICSSGGCSYILVSSVALILQQWAFIAGTFDGTQMNMYINGNLVGSQSANYLLPTLSRSGPYIGKSNWPSDGYSYSYIDELRFYNRSFTMSQINEIMALNSSSIGNLTDCTPIITTTLTTTITSVTILTSKNNV